MAEVPRRKTRDGDDFHGLRDLTHEGRTDLPPAEWWNDPGRTLEEMSRYVPVVGDPLIYGNAWSNSGVLPKSVPIDLDDPKFDIELPAYGDQIARFYEYMCDFIAAKPEPYLPDLLCAVGPEFVQRDQQLSNACDVLRPLLDAAMWRPKPNPEYYRKVKNSVAAPYISMLNGWVSLKPTEPLRVLVVGSWSGADIQRVALARKSLALLTIDTFDPFASESWDFEFRQIVREKFHMDLDGRHYSCALPQFAKEMEGRHYDLVLAANSLHQFMRNMGEFRLILHVISTLLGHNGTLLGMYPSLEGFSTIEEGRDTALLNVSPPLSSDCCPEGTMRVKIANVIIEDPIMQPETLISEFNRVGIFIDTMPAIVAAERYIVPSHLSCGPESRGYLYFHGSRIESANMPIGEVPANPPTFENVSVFEPDDVPVQMFHPRDVGLPITIEDSWFLQKCRYYCAEKLDGVGGILGIFPAVGGGARCMLRTGPPMLSKIRMWFEPMYRGPVLVVDGEYMELGEGWMFDVCGLVQYGSLRGMSWYPGMTLFVQWLRAQRRRGLFTHIGNKLWRLSTPRVLEDLWSSVREGIVMKYVCAPEARMMGGLELGNAKYVKRVTTFDILPKLGAGGWEPPIRALPYNFCLGEIAECRIVKDEYVFVRVRRDKHKPNSPDIIAQRKQSVDYETVLRWVGIQCDTSVEVVSLSDPVWRVVLELGDATPVHVRLTVAATGMRRIEYENAAGHRREILLVYDLRAKWLKEFLSGAYDHLVQA